MFDLLLHVLFTINACAVLAFTIALVRQRLAPDYIGFRNHFVLLSLLVIAAKIGYVVLFVILRPEQVLSTDGYRYLSEMQQIAVTPWEWNPILGTGPNYQDTPKMGMSYVYGMILFLHGGIASLYAVLVINVVVSYLTCVVVFLLTLRVSSAVIPAFTAMFLTAVYPETLYWNARVVRENPTLLLVTALVYAAISLFESHRRRYVVYLLMLTGLLLITRAQLALFLPLILAYYAGVLLMRVRHIRSARSIPALIFFGLLMLAAFGFISQQIRAVGGGRLFELLHMGPALFAMFASNIGSVLSLAAREEHGSLGILLVPFALMMFGLLIATLVRFRRIFPERYVSAGLMAFLIVIFISTLALMGLSNIRFRSTVAPLELCLVSVACYYYWRALKLRRIVLWPIRRAD